MNGKMTLRLFYNSGVILWSGAYFCQDVSYLTAFVSITYITRIIISPPALLVFGDRKDYTYHRIAQRIAAASFTPSLVHQSICSKMMQNPPFVVELRVQWRIKV